MRRRRLAQSLPLPFAPTLSPRSEPDETVAEHTSVPDYVDSYRENPMLLLIKPCQLGQLPSCCSAWCDVLVLVTARLHTLATRLCTVHTVVVMMRLQLAISPIGTKDGK